MLLLVHILQEFQFILVEPDPRAGRALVDLNGELRTDKTAVHVFFIVQA